MRGERFEHGAICFSQAVGQLLQLRARVLDRFFRAVHALFARRVEPKRIKPSSSSSSDAREPSTSTSAARAASSAERRASSARCCASGVTLYSRATGVTGGTGAIKGGLDIVQSVLGRVNNELSEPFATTGDMTIAE